MSSLCLVLYTYPFGICIFGAAFDFTVFLEISGHGSVHIGRDRTDQVAICMRFGSLLMDTFYNPCKRKSMVWYKDNNSLEY